MEVGKPKKIILLLQPMKNQETILFVSPRLSGFAKNDLDILSQRYRVKQNIYDWDKKSKTPLHLIKQFTFLLFNIWSINKIVIEFAGYWSLLPTLFGKLLGKKSIIITHGTDCANLTSLQYGSLGRKYLKTFCYLSFRLTDLICPVSESLIKVENHFHNKPNEVEQGILSFFPNIKTPFKVIHNCLDIDFWKTTSYNKKSNSFLAVFSSQQYQLKGGELIFTMAFRMKNCTFEIAGLEKPTSLINIPENITFLGHLNKDELKEKYIEHEFYFQLSSFEGFGLSLCEAMLGQCIPIGSSVNMIPEIISDNGYVLENKNAFELEKILNDAIQKTDKKEVASKAQKSIINRYSIESRSDKLLEILRELN